MQLSEGEFLTNILKRGCFDNPVGSKIGSIIRLNHDGADFVVEKISKYKTTIDEIDFYHFDYHLKGISHHQEPIRAKMRLIQEEDCYRIQFLYLCKETDYDPVLHKKVEDLSGEFYITHSDDGKELPFARQYWRVGSNEVCSKPDAYHFECVNLNSENVYKTICWEFSRMTDDDFGDEFEEFLTIEMNEETGVFVTLRGIEVQPSQIVVF